MSIMDRSGALELKIFHSGLARAAERAFGHERCPCCRGAMLGKPKRRAQRKMAHVVRQQKTAAHNIAVAIGGNPEVFVYACYACNQEQGAMPFIAWGKLLERRGDARAEDVIALGRFVEQWCSEHGVPLHAPKTSGRRERLIGREEVEVNG